jgi:hypothetical protein
LREALAIPSTRAEDLDGVVLEEAIHGLKFSDCLPEQLAVRVAASRPTDEPSRRQV